MHVCVHTYLSPGLKYTKWFQFIVHGINLTHVDNSQFFICLMTAEWTSSTWSNRSAIIMSSTHAHCACTLANSYTTCNIDRDEFYCAIPDKCGFIKYGTIPPGQVMGVLVSTHRRCSIKTYHYICVVSAVHKSCRFIEIYAKCVHLQNCVHNFKNKHFMSH